MIIIDSSSILDNCTINGRISKKLCEKLILPQIEKLQEQNKIMREALEYYASTKNWKYATDSGLDRSEFNDNDDEFIMGEGHVYGKRAREALAKVNNENN